MTFNSDLGPGGPGDAGGGDTGMPGGAGDVGIESGGIGGAGGGGSIADETGRDLGNLGDDVQNTGDLTFPTPQPAESSM